MDILIARTSFFINMYKHMASFKEKKSKLRLVMPNMTNEKFINFQIKVLWDETIGIINHNTMHVTYVMISRLPIFSYPM